MVEKKLTSKHIFVECLRLMVDPNYVYESWEILYRDFINNIWSTLVEEEKRELLEKKFIEMMKQ